MDRERHLRRFWGGVRQLVLVQPDHRSEVESLDMGSIGGWLESNTSRAHVFIPATAPDCALALVESFLQCRLRPIYEAKSLPSTG